VKRRRDDNEDRRGPVDNYPQILATLREAVDRAEGNASLAALSARDVTDWLNVTGITGYYTSQRDQAAENLLEARNAARRLANDLDVALAWMRSIP